MILIMLGFMIGMLILSYYVNGKDIVAPANVLLITFIISTIAALYNEKVWKFEIGGYSAFLILISLFFSICINAIFHNHFSKHHLTVKNEKLYALNYSVLIFFIFYLVFCVYVQYQVIRAIGNSSFSASMHIYRLANSYGMGTVTSGGVSAKLVDISTAITYICIFNLICFWKEVNLKYKIVNIFEILLWALLYFLQGARFEVFSVVVSIFVIYYFRQISNSGKYKVYSIKQIIKLICLAIALLYLFYILKDFVGRRTEKTIVEYITGYLGGSLPNFDLFIKDPPAKSEIIGQETFYSLVEGLKRRGIIKAERYSIHKEFRVSNGIGLGNVYTALRDYYFDFGLVGMFFLHILFSGFFSWFYEKEKVKISGYTLIILSMLYSCVVFYTFNNSFFSTKISISFLVMLVYVTILYFFLIKKKIVFKWKN